MKRNVLWSVISTLLVASMALAACAPAATPTTAPAAPAAATATQEPVAATIVPSQTMAPAAAATNTPAAAAATAAPTATTAAAAQTCSGTPVTVKVHDWSSADRQQYWDQVIKAFNDAHPCIKAESVKLPDDRAVRLQQIAAGTAPDLVAFDSSDLPRVYLMGALMDLTPVMAKDTSFDPSKEFFESVWKTGFADGKPVAIAKDYSVSAFYVNTGLFEKAGLEVPKEGWTYDDFLKLAQQLTVDKNGNNATSPDFDPKNVAVWGATFPYGDATTGWWRGFQSFLYSMGTHTISDDGKKTTGFLNSDAAVKAWTWYRDMIFKYHVSPSATYYSASNVGNDKLFSQGQLAIASTYWGPWFQDTFNQVPGLKWQVVPLPTGPGGHYAAIMWMGWGINAKSQHPDEAWQLLKWLTTDPGQRVFALKALTGDQSVAAELQQAKDPYWGVFLNEVPHQARLDDGTTPFYTTCVDIPAGKLMSKVFSDGGDKVDIKAELDKLAADADKCLSESKVEPMK